MVFPPKKETRKTVCANKIIENYAPSVIYTSMARASANKQQAERKTNWKKKRNSYIIEIYCRMSDMVRTSLIDCALLSTHSSSCLHKHRYKPEILLLPIIRCVQRSSNRSIDWSTINKIYVTLDSFHSVLPLLLSHSHSLCLLWHILASITMLPHIIRSGAFPIRFFVCVDWNGLDFFPLHSFKSLMQLPTKSIEFRNVWFLDRFQKKSIYYKSNEIHLWFVICIKMQLTYMAYYSVAMRLLCWFIFIDTVCTFWRIIRNNF